MTGPDDILPPPMVVKPQPKPDPQYTEPLRRKLAMLGAERFGVEPGDVRVDPVSERYGWCRSHEVMVMWTLATGPPRKTLVFVAPDGSVAHIVEGRPLLHGELTTESMAPASAILRDAGLLDPRAPVSLLVSGFITVICQPPVEVLSPDNANAKLMFSAGMGMPIETWVSPNGEPGLDVVRRCSRDPEIAWQGDHFRLGFCTLGGAIESWDVVGNSDRLLEANAQVEVPRGLFPQRC